MHLCIKNSNRSTGLALFFAIIMQNIRMKCHACFAPFSSWSFLQLLAVQKSPYSLNVKCIYCKVGKDMLPVWELASLSVKPGVQRFVT